MHWKYHLMIKMSSEIDKVNKTIAYEKPKNENAD